MVRRQHRQIEQSSIISRSTGSSVYAFSVRTPLRMASSTFQRSSFSRCLTSSRRSWPSSTATCSFRRRGRARRVRGPPRRRGERLPLVAVDRQSSSARSARSASRSEASSVSRMRRSLVSLLDLLAGRPRPAARSSPASARPGPRGRRRDPRARGLGLLGVDPVLVPGDVPGDRDDRVRGDCRERDDDGGARHAEALGDAGHRAPVRRCALKASTPRSMRAGGRHRQRALRLGLGELDPRARPGGGETRPRASPCSGASSSTGGAREPPRAASPAPWPRARRGCTPTRGARRW